MKLNLDKLFKLNYFYITLILLIVVISGITIARYTYKHIQLKKNLFNEIFLKELNYNNGIDRVKKIKIKFNGESFTVIADQDGNWFVEEKGNFPALGLKIKELVCDLADLKIIEPKTAKPENFAALLLEDLKINNNTTHIQLLDHDNKEISSIYLGKKEFIASSNADYKAHIFVRRPNETQTWLVAGKMPEGFAFKDLVKQPLFNINLSNISQVELNKTTQLINSHIRIVRHPITKEFMLLDVSPRYKVKEQYVIDNIVQQFSYLNYDDVILDSPDANTVLNGKLTLSFLPSSNVVDNSSVPATAITTKDKEPSNAVPPPVEPTTDNHDVQTKGPVTEHSNEQVKEQPKEQVINFELVSLNKNYYLKINNVPAINSNWLYKISDYAYQSLLINKKDLITDASSKK